MKKLGADERIHNENEGLNIPPCSWNLFNPCNSNISQNIMEWNQDVLPRMSMHVCMKFQKNPLCYHEGRDSNRRQFEIMANFQHLSITFKIWKKSEAHLKLKIDILYWRLELLRLRYVMLTTVLHTVSYKKCARSSSTPGADSILEKKNIEKDLPWFPKIVFQYVAKIYLYTVSNSIILRTFFHSLHPGWTIIIYISPAFQAKWWILPWLWKKNISPPQKKTYIQLYSYITQTLLSIP